MNDERRNGGQGRDGGAGGDVDGLAGPEEETVVIVSDEYTRAAIGRLGDGLRDAAALCDRFREGGEADSRREAVIAIGELVERLVEIRLHAEGAERGARRVEREQIAKLKEEAP
jgi:hypothetical protein